MTDSRGAVLAWDGEADHHEPDVVALADEVIRTGRQQVLSHNSIQCDRVDCEIRGIVVEPLEIEGSIVGTLAALTNQTAGPVLLRATGEVARYVSSQLELAELDESRARLNRAEVRALRAQISPHFVYNALTTIASFIRTDPVRARELLIEFADFTRYSFRTAGEYTTLKDELNNIERYIRLEKARFGDRLNIKLEIAPEVLSVVLPFLALQPLVENAVRHGLSAQAERRHDHDHRGERGRRVRDHRRGRRRRAWIPHACATTSATRTSRVPTSGWATSTTGCARRSATTSAWWSTRTSARA